MNTINVGDLVLATEALETPTLGIVINVIDHATYVGVESVEVWWADNARSTVMLKQYAVALKKELDKYLKG